MKSALVLGAGGFIGSHLVKRLKAEGYWVRGVDLKFPDFSPSLADDFVIGDLRLLSVCEKIFDLKFDEVYQLAADIGGAGYLFTGENDANVMHNSAMINLNVVNLSSRSQTKAGKVFFSSSACVYSQFNQADPLRPNCEESSVYPAMPDSDYGWEKLFSERLYFAYKRNYNLDVRVARFHNIFGPEGTWQGGKEKAPAALCRKVAQAEDHSFIEIWGDGKQTRSFLFIDECIEAIRRFMQSSFAGPMNIGSEEMVTINELAKLVIQASGKNLSIRHMPGPIGVNGRNSHNQLMREKLSWEPTALLYHGIVTTYQWINRQVNPACKQVHSNDEVTLGI